MIAAPTVAGRFFDDLRPHRIVMNILEEGKKVSLSVAQYRLVAALEQMTDRAVCPVEIHRIALVDALQNLG